MYYKTTPIDNLHEAQVATIKQDDAIYELLKSGESLDCWEIADRLGMIITSVRRSLNSLCADGKVDVVSYVPGRMGRPVGLYRIKSLRLF